jgi:hypothetical protein
MRLVTFCACSKILPTCGHEEVGFGAAQDENEELHDADSDHGGACFVDVTKAEEPRGKESEGGNEIIEPEMRAKGDGLDEAEFVGGEKTVRDDDQAEEARQDDRRTLGVGEAEDVRADEEEEAGHVIDETVHGGIYDFHVGCGVRRCAREARSSWRADYQMEVNPCGA